MLTAEGCRARRDRLWQSLPSPADLLILFSPSSLAWGANYFQPPFSFRVNDAGAFLLLTPDAKATLVADNLLEEFAHSAFVDQTVLPVWYRGVDPAPPRQAFLVRNFLEQLNRLLPTSGSVRIGLEMSAAPAGLVQGLCENVPSLELFDLDLVLPKLRRRKLPDEVNLLRQAMNAAAAGFQAVAEELRPGMTEMDVFHLVCRSAMNAAGGQAWIYGDFASGPRTAEGGGPPTGRTIQAGELFILDYSVALGEYRSDFANTWGVATDGSPKQRQMAATCLEAMHAGEQRLRLGMPVAEVYHALRSVFQAGGVAEHFTHHAGHGLGLGHPEPPFLVPASTEVLQEGDVVTLEPGLYFPNEWGMRFERNYLITATGFEILSPHRLGLDR